MKPLIKNFIYTILFMAITFDLLSCLKLKQIYINSDDESKFMDAIEESNINGAIIYINTTVINVNGAINMTGDLRWSIYGIRQENGYPRIHFVNKDGSNSGINIYGINKDLQYVIVENANGNGISI